ncbi:DUF1214 domain-containing protein [Sulfitobacter sp. SK012]|uniref:DUF1214 domain-containing protein n=1 Tax=Sulfitobacter sp. SK012 TaxID=1389005 RepID=UPI001C1FF0CE|nr:DUF1214 domain-containing protein [Sulfitobacter sp. SK012]
MKQKTKSMIFSGVFALSACAAAFSYAAESVTVDNFVRAETDRTMAAYVAQGGFGQFFHIREVVAIDKQDVIRMQRDTLYSIGVFDLTNPITITLPESDGRYLSALIINQDHSMLPMEYAAGEFTLTQDLMGTRYAVVILRTFVNANDPADVAVGVDLQDAVTIAQDDPGVFEVPDWDLEQVEALRTAINVLAATKEDTSGYFGDKNELNPIDHLLGTAFGWGGNPKEATIYLNAVPATNDGQTPHRMEIPNKIPINDGGFVSITMYNAEGYMQENDLGMYSVNNATAERNEDGSVTIHAGGCDDGRVNCLPITEGWNYIVRMYKPGPEIISGEYQFPVFEPVN